jgi:RHS repeat-associated protein
LAYNSTDDVTSINQGSSTTTFSYDTETRRLNETNNTVTTTRHYTDSTDNPAWVTQNGSNPKTEIYTPSLGAGLNITTTIEGTIKTADIQLQDLRGNTVTTIDLTTHTATGWNSYDEFGNPETPTNNTNLIKYTTYAKAERATNTTGLILMGARVYNPTTNQFTAPDPIKGGNENTYTYPNDPINKSDFTGLWSWWDTLDVALTVASFIPIPGLQQIAWIAKGVSAAAKAYKFVVKTEKLLAAIAKAEKVAIRNKSHFGTAKGQWSKEVIDNAGKKFTGSSESVRFEGRVDGYRGTLSGQERMYRSPTYKNRSKRFEANFQNNVHGLNYKGNHNYTNIHVVWKR